MQKALMCLCIVLAGCSTPQNGAGDDAGVPATDEPKPFGATWSLEWRTESSGEWNGWTFIEQTAGSCVLLADLRIDLVDGSFRETVTLEGTDENGDVYDRHDSDDPYVPPPTAICTGSRRLAFDNEHRWQARLDVFYQGVLAVQFQSNGEEPTPQET